MDLKKVPIDLDMVSTRRCLLRASSKRAVCQVADLIGWGIAKILVVALRLNSQSLRGRLTNHRSTPRRRKIFQGKRRSWKRSKSCSWCCFISTAMTLAWLRVISVLTSPNPGLRTGLRDCSQIALVASPMFGVIPL